VHVALKAAEELRRQDMEAEVVDLKTLRPWDKDTVSESVARTHRAMVVEEPPPVCGIGAEIATNLYEIVFDDLDAPVERVSGADVPLPYAKNLEQACIPHAPDVVRAGRKLMGLEP
jgi:pyruvate dehydrogenase E1 component beta subunit